MCVQSSERQKGGKRGKKGGKEGGCGGCEGGGWGGGGGMGGGKGADISLVASGLRQFGFQPRLQSRSRATQKNQNRKGVGNQCKGEDRSSPSPHSFSPITASFFTFPTACVSEYKVVIFSFFFFFVFSFCLFVCLFVIPPWKKPAVLVLRESDKSRNSGASHSALLAGVAQKEGDSASANSRVR